jgi:hypothetical protein
MEIVAIFIILGFWQAPTNSFSASTVIRINDWWEVFNYTYVSSGFDVSNHFSSSQRVKQPLAHWLIYKTFDNF